MKIIDVIGSNPRVPVTISLLKVGFKYYKLAKLKSFLSL
jgi:hypothetical protein